MTGKTLTPAQHAAIEAEVKMMLHASRDCMRNKGVDTTSMTFDVRDGYAGEAFGVMRALKVLGIGEFGPVVGEYNGRGVNLKSWFARLEDAVLHEEGFHGNNKCDHCLERYGKDGAGRKRKTV